MDSHSYASSRDEWQRWVSASGAGTGVLDAVSEVNLAGGNASVVYEVVDSNPSAIESAQIPILSE